MSYCNAINLVLADRFPGLPTMDVPARNLAGSLVHTDYHNVSSSAYQPGAKIRLYDPASLGEAILVYLKYKAGAVTGAAGKLCTCYDASSPVWYQVTNDGDDGMLNAPAAIMLSAMTDGYWGWFWGAGVCPRSFVAALATAQVPTDGNVVVGAMAVADITGTDEMGFTVVGNTAETAGWSMEADT